MKKFLLNVIRNDTKESSKRVVLLILAVLMIVLTSIYTNSKNFVEIFDSLKWMILMLFGISEGGKNIGKIWSKKEKNQE